MDWDIVTARNGDKSLKLNGMSIYSNYRPREDAWKWVENEFDVEADSYLLIGLGLGYHAEKLTKLAGEKPVFVYYFHEFEKRFVQSNNLNVELVSTLEGIVLSKNIQVMIPNVWIRALGENHPLLPYLEDIKINQITYKKSSEMMRINFMKNMQLKDFKPYPKFNHTIACLISSGPSLDETLEWVKDVQEDIDIFVVGSALKLVIAQKIKPSAVIISDPKLTIKRQLENVNYDGPLFYLSTTNHETVCEHKGNRFILFQQGYYEAEKSGNELGFPLIETGGSVATTAFSLIESLGYTMLVLFGQDLGFNEDKTHAVKSTSGRQIKPSEKYKTIISNSGEEIKTSSNLSTYLRWFNKKIGNSKMRVYNTAWFGAKIANTPYIDKQQFHKLLRD
ncbi:hypothetical protein MTP04_09430 [Lysinibacillus sp. PLM2]|nr:hypothetical protein MTP04_09430 [Lysinibacillus sp. PLM2]